MLGPILVLITGPGTLIAAQWNFGGSGYTPGTVNFTQECYDAVQNCVDQFAANQPG